MMKRSEDSLLNFLRPARGQAALAATLVVALCSAVSLAFVFAVPYLTDWQSWIFIFFLILFPIVGVQTAILMILRETRRLAVSQKDDFVPWQIISPENQRRKLNAETAELAQILSLAADQISDLRSAYVVAEDLILRKIEQEEKASLMRRVSLERMELDAVLIKQEVIKCVEVMFLVEPGVKKEKINAILRKIEYLKAIFERLRPGTRLVLVLALVTQIERAAETKLRTNVAGAIVETATDVEIRHWDFEELQNIFTSG